MYQIIAALMLVVSEVLSLINFVSNSTQPFTGILQTGLWIIIRLVYGKSKQICEDALKSRQLRLELKAKQQEIILQLGKMLEEKNKLEALENGMTVIPIEDDNKEHVELSVQIKPVDPNRISRN
jgi:hypothetical protein